jgi:hypothetical protein
MSIKKNVEKLKFKNFILLNSSNLKNLFKQYE